MTCSRCKQENLPAMKFCGECGTPLQRRQTDAPPAPSYADLQRSATEALEQQTATSDILRVISRFPTDVQPVFDAIVRNSVDLCHGVFSTAFRFDGERIHLAAQHNISPEGLAELHRIYPARPTRAFITGRAIL